MSGVRERRLRGYRLLRLKPVKDEQGMVPCIKHLEKRKEETKPCHLGLMPFVAKHASLPEIMVVGG